MSGVPVRDRRKALLLLAGSLHDYSAGPKPGKSPTSSRNERGRQAAYKKELCVKCDGDKVTKDKFGRDQECKECSGEGYFLVDPMMNVEVSKWSDPPTSAFTRRAMCDRCGGECVWKGERCELCNGSGKVSVPIVRDMGGPEQSSDDLGAWDRAIARRDEAGSYHELDLALDRLSRLRRRLFWAVHVTGSHGLLSGTEATELERAVVELLGWMPDPIVVPRDVVAGDKRKPQDAPKGRHSLNLVERDAEIVRRFRDGEKAKAIAADIGLSVQRVNEILYEERVA